MKNEHKAFIAIGLCAVAIFAVFMVTRNLAISRNLREREAFCNLLGENLTLELQHNESYVEECECNFESVISLNMEALCICACYTDGSVCPRIDSLGRCYFTLFMSNNPGT